MKILLNCKQKKSYQQKIEKGEQPQEKLINSPELNAKINFAEEMLSRDF